MPLEKKAQFIAKFEKNKGNLSWVNSFVETTSSVKSVKVDTVDNFLNMNQIMHLNGFHPKDFDTPEESDRMLKLMIKQSEEANSYVSETQEHPTEPRLNRYFYVHNQGIKKSEGTEDSSSFVATGDVAKNKLQSLVDAARGQDVDIKMEAPVLVELKSKCYVLQSGKLKLQSALTQASDCLAELKARDTTHDSFGELIKEVGTCLEAGYTFLSEIRDSLPLMQSHKVDGDQAKAFMPKVDALTQKTLVHIDGLKLKQRQMKTWM